MEPVMMDLFATADRRLLNKFLALLDIIPLEELLNAQNATLVNIRPVVKCFALCAKLVNIRRFKLAEIALAVILVDIKIEAG